MHAQTTIHNLHQRLRITGLENRIAILEEHVLKAPKRLRATEAQRFLIAFYLGQFNKIMEYTISQKQKGITLSVMLDIDPDNARKFLAEIPKKEKTLLHTESNYTFLVQFFIDNGYKELQEEADHILIAIQNAKDKKNDSRT